jgi:hypothetical protein
MKKGLNPHREKKILRGSFGKEEKNVNSGHCSLIDGKKIVAMALRNCREVC